MTFISLTRLRIRSIRFVPLFFIYATRSISQVKQSPGFLKGSLLNDKHFTFWTMTAWDSLDSMRAYMTTGAHKQAMPKLLHWCNEASVAHWQQESSALPSWTEADRRMRTEGRISKVLHPSPNHATLSYAAPRTTGAAPIAPNKAAV
jgi:hypothetical protein